MTDLEYLAKEAFEFDLEINPSAGAFVSVQTIIDEREPEEDDWISIDQMEEAIRTNKLVIGTVYPNGSVSFFKVYGTDVLAVVAKCAELCRADRARYRGAL